LLGGFLFLEGFGEEINKFKFGCCGEPRIAIYEPIFDFFLVETLTLYLMLLWRFH
jgi:hypothetical protein